MADDLQAILMPFFARLEEEGKKKHIRCLPHLGIIQAREKGMWITLICNVDWLNRRESIIKDSV